MAQDRLQTVRLVGPSTNGPGSQMVLDRLQMVLGRLQTVQGSQMVRNTPAFRPAAFRLVS